jgi:hypothetical protein
MLREPDRDALPSHRSAGVGRPEANSDLHKWTADGLSSTAGPAAISNAGGNLGDSHQAKFLAGQLRVVLQFAEKLKMLCSAPKGHFSLKDLWHR